MILFGERGLNCISSHATCAVAKPITKNTLLREAAARQDWVRALSIANKFPQLGAYKEAITQGHCAIQNPAFYRQIGQDPAALVAAGIQALQARYQLP